MIISWNQRFHELEITDQAFGADDVTGYCSEIYSYGSNNSDDDDDDDDDNDDDDQGGDDGANTWM